MNHNYINLSILLQSHLHYYKLIYIIAIYSILLKLYLLYIVTLFALCHNLIYTIAISAILYYKLIYIRLQL